ncbi:hypothetical protein HH763_004587 [Escherichia coli]|nr:hypothetical protein [Escherichia coli]
MTSATGSRASKYNACIARSFIVGRPPPPDAGRLHVTSRFHAIRRSGFIVLTASHPTVTSDACVSRLLMTEHQVP